MGWAQMVGLALATVIYFIPACDAPRVGGQEGKRAGPRLHLNTLFLHLQILQTITIGVTQHVCIAAPHALFPTYCR